MIQTPDVNYRVISYRKDLREKLIKVEENHSPIKRKNIKRKINYKDNSKIDIEINKDTILMEQNKAPFKYRKIMDEICPNVTIGTILKEKKNSDCISLHCFIDLKTAQVYPLNFHIHQLPSTKKVTCNDNTCTIKLTLWGSCIDYVNESSVYFVQEAKVREWPKGILSITTTPSTSIKPSEESIVKSKSSQKELISYSVQFPPTSVKIASYIKCCPQCGKSSVNVTGKLFTCEHCKEMTLADETETRYTLKLTFKYRFQHVVTMYSLQLIQYFQIKEKSIPQDPNELVLKYYQINLLE